MNARKGKQKGRILWAADEHHLRKQDWSLGFTSHKIVSVYL